MKLPSPIDVAVSIFQHTYAAVLAIYLMCRYGPDKALDMVKIDHARLKKSLEKSKKKIKEKPNEIHIKKALRR